MSLFKHTPAPWFVVHNSWDISTVRTEDVSVVALIPIGDMTCDEDQEKIEAIKEANSHLIAAAPDMHLALGMVADTIAFQFMGEVERGIVLSALSKAIGEQA